MTEPLWQSAANAPSSAKMNPAYLSEGVDVLKRRLQSEGFLYLPGLLSRQWVREIRAEVDSCLRNAGWLEGERPVGSRACTIGDQAYWAPFEQMMMLPVVSELATCGTLMDLCAALLSTEVIFQPRRVPRIVFPEPFERSETAAHQDFPYVQGSLDTLTAWLPIGDVSRENGALEVLRGSHLGGLREILGVGRYKCSPTIVDHCSTDWRGVDFLAGDVLLFTSLTIHRARPNRLPEHFRISMDCRFQPQQAPMCSAVMTPPFWPSIADWGTILPSHPEYWRLPKGLKTVEYREPRDFRPDQCGEYLPWLRTLTSV